MSFIKDTNMETLINNAFSGLETMLGVNNRTREIDGTFKADDPSTPNVNEAWSSGKSPKKKKATKKKTK